MLQWNGVNYWQLSMELNAFRETNFPVEYLVMNYTGIYLVGRNGTGTVLQVILFDSSNVSANPWSFSMLKLESNGMITIVNNNVKDGSMNEVFTRPADSCQIPLICGRLGLCSNEQCSCDVKFRPDPKRNSNGCIPTNGSLALPVPCDGSSSDGISIRYLNLSYNADYFSNDFSDPLMDGVSLSACQNLCSTNCSCLGVFYNQGSGSCYVIRDYLGSIFTSNTNRLGYIKTVTLEKPRGDSGKMKSGFLVLAVVLPLSSGLILIALVAALWRRKTRTQSETAKALKFGPSISPFAKGDSFVCIPGFLARFEYEELSAATEGFRIEIGSGGFGTVYRGALGDGTDVAVKRIKRLGAEAKREFLTEIATIGTICHVNLVNLKGFCAQRGQRFLVYEYMNRGSLDRTLFHGEPVLEWKERHQIALGTARGLAYLHTDCGHKILHCDVKPENILLHDRSVVKIADFGLSKLLNREQSGTFTLMRGTRGSIAPEWLTNTAISDKTDVYSYGMVLVEIISGRKNFFLEAERRSSDHSSSSSEEYEHRLINFPLRALEMHLERRYLELVDTRLTGEVPSDEVEKLVRVALCCIHREPNLRPSMSDVVGMLESKRALANPRIEQLNFLRFYSPETSTENNVQNVVVQSQEMSSINNFRNPFSRISAQQVSGPR